MILPVDVVNYILIAIMAGVMGTWAWLIKDMISTYMKTPHLDILTKSRQGTPRVSIILPARNEEKYVGRCLESLLDQKYSEYEVIAVDDSSNDRTGEIIKLHAKKDPRVVYVIADPKPDGWMGKNWACMQGYYRATGNLLLFTDSDTQHSSEMVRLAVNHLLSLNLDAVTVIPRLLCMDFWTKITLPVISTFLHTRFSALRVNDPSSKTGYFFGSFFIIRREVYEAVGTHKGVKSEIIEDGALGRRVKESGYRIKMVRGDDLLDAVWARDLSTLWNALKRLMVPLYLHNRNTAMSAFFAVLFLLFIPFTLLAYSVAMLDLAPTFQVLLAFSLAASCMIYAGTIIETRILHLSILYALLCPLGGLLILLGFQSGLVHAKSDASVKWRDRTYSMKDYGKNFPL